MGGIEFSTLYREHMPLVRHVLMQRGIRGADLDDAVSEAFMAIYRQLPTFEGRASLSTWIHAVVWRTAMAYVRRAHRRYEMPAGSPEPAPDRGPSDLDAFDDLHESLARIRDDSRDLLVLHEVGGLSVTALSRLTGLARATIAQRIEHAKQAIGRSLTAVAGRHHADACVTGDHGLLPERARDEPSVARPSYTGVTRPHFAATRVGDCVIAVWRGFSDGKTIDEITELLARTAGETLEGVTYMSVIEASSSPPDRTGRESIARAAVQLAGKVKAVAIVPESSAVRALAVPIFNAYIFLSRQAIDLRFFDGVAVAADWIAPRSGMSAQQIETAIEATRARIPLSHSAPSAGAAQATCPDSGERAHSKPQAAHGSS
jgi:RNA polymerase sigma-70 factor (ECF subfamily)